MELISIVKQAWGWTGIHPVEIVGDSAFGNLMIKDDVGRYWRLCPEDLYCKVVAQNQAELGELSRNQEFLHDWHMAKLVDQAKLTLGSLRPGYKYSLKIPGILGGEYGGSNLATTSLSELVAASGHIAKQIRDLPSGSKIQINVI